MLRKLPPLLWLAIPMAYVLYFYGLGGTGLLGPDEPRYAAIGREMAHSGDWVTPRLWGHPWFEKPALLYWMTGAAFRLGLGPDIAPRLPVALMSFAFLVFYWWILRREFGCLAAWLATLILGTSAAWIGFSQVGVTDLPLTCTFSAAMLLALPWVARRETRYLPAAAAFLGAAVLAKGLVPLVLAFPLILGARQWRDLLRVRVIAPFALVALPWYILCWMQNGPAFLYDFFVRHHFSRFMSDALMHVRPWWFYLPVLAGLLLPWTPLLPLAARRTAYRDRHRLFLLLWAGFGLVFFSASVNKLGGYLLPLLPAIAALLGLALEEVRTARPWLVCCALLLVVFPIAVPMLPTAVAEGLSRAPRPAFHWTWLLPIVPAVAAAWMEAKARRLAALASVAVAATIGVFWLKTADLPSLDRAASARTLWRAVSPQVNQTCVQDLRRDWRYGLNYYSVSPLAECSDRPAPFRIVQVSDDSPELVPATRVAR